MHVPVSTSLTAWISGTQAFCKEWEAALADRLGAVASTAPALTLPVGEAPGRQWRLKSARAALDIHDWVVACSRLPAPEGTGVLVLAGWAAETAQKSDSDFWLGALVREKGAQDVIVPGWSETWALVHGVRTAREDDSRAAQVSATRLLTGLPVWKAWKAEQRQEGLEKSLSTVPDTPLPRRPRV